MMSSKLWRMNGFMLMLVAGIVWCYGISTARQINALEKELEVTGFCELGEEIDRLEEKAGMFGVATSTITLLATASFLASVVCRVIEKAREEKEQAQEQA